MFAVWRLADIIQDNAGRSSDLSWDLPGATLLSLCEVYIASLCASIPFFWPIIKEQIQKLQEIFVKYEFSVSTESRFHANDDDAVELAPTPGTDDVVSLGSKSANQSTKQVYPDKHHADDYIQAQINPFSEEFRTETAVQSGMSGRKKGGFVQFKNLG